MVRVTSESRPCMLPPIGCLHLDARVLRCAAIYTNMHDEGHKTWYRQVNSYYGEGKEMLYNYL